MTDYTDLDNEQLEELRKALQRAANTQQAREPWQEHFDRNTSSKSKQSILASDIVQGFSGSWAASFNYGLGAGITAGIGTKNERRADTASVPVPVRNKTTKLGRRGVPDIDFVPFNWRTNRFGNKGPSLVGHPIVYEVVGPTLKSPATDWTWDVTAASGPNGGDELTMSTRPDGAAAVVATLAGAYGADVPTFTMGGAGEPNGGLYVIITDDGANAGSIPGAATPMGALADFVDTARYEIFRVVSARDGILELHLDKPLGNFFDLGAPSPRTIRAITIIRPYVTRIAAIPGSGAGPGQERMFAVVTPEISASSDLYPPFDGGTAGDGTWLQGGFDFFPGSLSSLITGVAAEYLGRQTLPIPLPLRKGLSLVETTGAALPSLSMAQWFVEDATGNPVATSPADVGNILFVYNIETEDDIPLTFGTRASTLGWFPVIAHVGAPNGLALSRTAEIDPTTAHIYYGPGPYLQLAAGPAHTLLWTIHEPVGQLWDGAFNIDKVQACRLKNLIDPRDVERHEKQISIGGAGGASQPQGASFSGPERTIWDTSISGSGPPPPNSANPGSLLDLGFRMVLFPAKDDGTGVAVPDFDKPIDTRGELIIDPSITDERQFIEVDYDGGLVRLSQAPPAAPGGDIIPNGIVGTASGFNNERAEVVLFAACVPYSMEEAQNGTGNRVVGRSATGDDIDVYSERIFASIDLTNTNGAGSAPYVGASAIAPNPVEIVLDRLWEGPNSGVIEILDGPIDGDSFGLWGYTEQRTVTVGVNSVTALGGITSLPTTITDPVLGGADPRSVIMRREVFFAETSVGHDFGTDNSTNDLAYGSAARSKTLRVDNSTVRHELDGSITVVPGTNPGYMWHQWGYLSASAVEDTVSSDDRLSENGILEDLFYQDQTGTDVSSNGFMSSDSDGQHINFIVGGVLNNFYGYVTRRAQIQLDHVFRLVFKFRFTHDAVTEQRAYVGLIGPDEGSDADSVSEATSDPLTASRDYIGVRLTGTLPITYQIVLRDGVGASQQIIDTLIPYEQQTLYAVIEATRVKSGATFVPDQVKMVIFDNQMRRLFDHIFTSDFPTRALEVVQGARNTEGAGTRRSYLYYATIVNRIDLPAPVF